MAPTSGSVRNTLTAKIGALYVEALPDPAALEAADDLEGLCTGLSQKIWHKIVLLQRSGDEKAGSLSAD
jgi:hypothetical protein